MMEDMLEGITLPTDSQLLDEWKAELDQMDADAREMGYHPNYGEDFARLLEIALKLRAENERLKLDNDGEPSQMISASALRELCERRIAKLKAGRIEANAEFLDELEKLIESE